MLLVAACSPPKPVSVAEPTPAPTPKPIPTPHPAQGAREQAVRLYPDLAKADSLFHRTFMEIFESEKAANPRSLTQVDWPIALAHRTGNMLSIQPVDPNFRPEPPPPAPIIVVAPTPVPTPKPREPSALERGAYNQKKDVTRQPEYRSYR